MIGEVHFDARRRRWTLVFSVNALAVLERAAGQPLHALAPRFIRPDRAFLRLLFQAGLHDHHAADARTVRRVIRAVGLRRACDLIGEAVIAAFPAPSKSEEGAAGVSSAQSADGEVGWDWLRLHKLWVECGGDPAAFWRQTPRLLQVYFDGKAAAAELEMRQRAWLAWHIAVLPQSKQMKGTFEKFLEGLVPAPKRETRRQTPEEQLAIAKAWTARLGGTIQ